MKYIITITVLFFQLLCFSQERKVPDIFERLQAEMHAFVLDTSAVPDDKITAKIRELRDLRGGFNINEALEYKLMEERQKKEIPEAELDRFENFMTPGKGKKWLDNAVIHIYRDLFTYRELKQLVKFYKTDAGKKMASDFPVIIAKTLAASETIKKRYESEGE